MASSDVPDDPLSRFSLSVFTVNGLLLRAGENVTRPLGQSSARWQVLGRAGFEPQTVAQMARDIGNSRQSVQRLADALARENLVAYTPNPSDKRAPLVELTPRGKKVLAAIYARQHKWSGRILNRLDARQLSDLADALEQIARVFEEYTD